MKADLHIHSCLSPCAGLDMSPLAIIRQAEHAGMDIISITDHNHSGNSAAVSELCSKTSLLFIPGIELCSSEEIHLLGYFPSIEAINEFQSWVSTRLPHVPNVPERTGDQPIVDAEENILELFPWYLNNALDATLEELVSRIHQQEGLAVPAHIDRPSYSVISQLGMLPDYPFDGLEVSSHWRQSHPEIAQQSGYQLLAGSDSHSLAEIGSCWQELSFHTDPFSALKNTLNSL